MSLRTFVPLGVLCALASATLAAPAEPAPVAIDATRPNILFIAVDDLNHWVGHLGRNKQAITPNLDKLASRGVTFARAYCVAPACNPSRAALMTGLRPSTTAVYHNSDDWRPVIPVDHSLVSHFRKNGYFTAGSGKIYHGSFDRHEEWDDYLKGGGGKKAAAKIKGNSDGVGGIKFAPIEGGDDAVSDHDIVDYGIAQLGRKHEKPFLLTVGLHKPHMPWNVPQKYYDMHPLDKIELPPTQSDDLADIPAAGVKIAKPEGDHKAMVASGRWKEAVQAYLAAGTYADAEIGRLLDALDKSAYRENTVIVLWGDHGWHLGEKEHWRKFSLWEEGTRAPLIWVAPGVTKTGGVCETPVDFMSIYPTLCDLAGLPVPEHVQGTSLRPLLADPSAKWDKPAITTHGFQNHGVRLGQWRYIRYTDGSEELYDHFTDPYEWKNIAAAPEHAEMKKKLAALLPAENKKPTNEGKAGGRRAGRAPAED